MICCRWLLATIAVAAFAGGCGKDNALESPTAARLKGLATMYLNHIVAKNGNSPASEKEFKQFLRTVDPIQLGLVGFERNKLDEVFVSQRDNEPFVLVYGVNPGTLGAKGGPVIAYEKTGVGGKRLVVNVGTELFHVDEQGLQELLKPKP